MASMAQAAQMASTAAQSGTAAVRNAGGSSTLAAAAAIGGVAGLVLLGPLTAVAAAGAAAYATTRTDEIGDVSRNVAAGAIDGVQAAKAFDKQHDITGKVSTAAQAVVHKAKEVSGGRGGGAGRRAELGEATFRAVPCSTIFSLALQLDAKHDIIGKTKAAAASAMQTAKEANEKHQITTRVGNGLASGLDWLSKKMDPSAASATPQPSAPAAPSSLPSVPHA